ncbi:hypothetical protein BKA70DRAFT_1238317 [Coprinopsis sp. MPI-PUGE-AT-0042]|nr:hypothetical protein BKA70DRAFT_1238317 [Coprinopsis sp. MPI-PUGE-AT-0042]
MSYNTLLNEIVGTIVKRRYTLLKAGEIVRGDTPPLGYTDRGESETATEDPTIVLPDDGMVEVLTHKVETKDLRFMSASESDLVDLAVKRGDTANALQHRVQEAEKDPISIHTSKREGYAFQVEL